MTTRGGAPRVLITYDHLSPAQVAALGRADALFSSAGFELQPVEFFGELRGYGWTLDDARRPRSWRCLYRDKVEMSRTRIFMDLAKLIRSERFDVAVVNGWFEPVSWWMAASKEILGLRLTMVGDSTAVDQRRRPMVEAAKRAFLSRMDSVFTAGTSQIEYLATLGVPADRVTVGCDVVENSRFHNVRAAALPSGPLVVGTAARLVPVKNLEAAIEAAARVAGDPATPRFQWRIAGRGPLDERLTARAIGTGAPVEFVGYVGYDSMPAFYAGLSMYWQPSLSEPWGLTINEAMASGLPILASDRCGCARDLVGIGNGWLHDPSPQGLEAGLRRALGESTRWAAMGQASLARIADWDLDRFASGLLGSVTLAMRGSASRTAREARQAG